MAEQAETINMHLLSVMDGDTKTKATVDLTGASYEMSLGNVCEGRYLGQVIKAEYKKTNDGTGVNVSTVVKIVGPTGCSEVGKNAFRDVPIPIGSLKDPKVMGKRFYYNLLMGSLISASGLNNPDKKPIEKEQIMALGALRDMSPADINGGLCFVNIVVVKQTQGRRKGEDKSELSYILHEDYAEAPGPREADAGAVAAVSTKVARTGSGQPNSVPVEVAETKAAPAATAKAAPASGGLGMASSFLDGN